MVPVFERPLTPGWVYPCTVKDINEQLSLIPSCELDGLAAVGLVPATRKDCRADGRYFFRDKPQVHLYSYPASLTYRQAAQTKRHETERGLAVEIAFGMCVEKQGSRWVCHWEADHLREFTLRHVLLHEIGHHVYWMERRRNGHKTLPRTAASEQFAEDYALRRHWPW